MARPYSQDLRDRFAAAITEGSSARAAAARFGLSESTGVRWAQRWRREGHAKARSMGGDRRSRLKAHRTIMLTLVAQQPDLTLKEIQSAIAVKTGLKVGVGTICRFFALHKVTLKKSLHAAEQQRPDVHEARCDFIRRQPSLEPGRLLFLDETAAVTNMTRIRGRCAKGLRLIAPVPHGHWKKSTLVAALSLDGIVAPYVMDGAMNGEIFLAYIQQMLSPLLKQGDILIMDNLSCHKVAGIREAVEGRGARLIYLPPYSQDLNPIKQAFSKLKAMLRKAGARTKEALWTEIGRVIENYSQSECLNLFKNSGYAT